MKVSTVSEMRALDRTAIETFGITEELLMENAGQAVYFVLLTEFGIAGQRFLVFCGLGNNGGDGLVVARKIHSSGGSVKALILGDPSKFKGAARLNFDIVSRLPIQLQRLESSATIPTEGILETDIADCDVIVDAILGTGITRNIDGLYRDVVQAINRSGKPVISVDIPSGVHGDTGKVMGVAVRADHTVTFGLPKMGNLLLPGYDLGGRLHVSHISFPPLMTESDALKAEINCPIHFPSRRERVPKGDLGKGLFIAGAAHYDRAAYFAALAFLKAGGGRACVAAPRPLTPFIASKRSEIILMPQAGTATGSIALENKRALLELARRMDIVLLGPGLSLEPETQELMRELAREIRKPLLIDGDGITAVCQDPQIIQGREAETVIMPHLGEMAEIVKKDVSKIDAQKVQVLQRACKELNATIVLRGPRLLIGYPNERVFFNMTGDPGMATGRCGEVLTGTIAAMFGLGLPVGPAVRLGVFVYGLCGDLATEGRADRRHAAGKEHLGEEGITAEDILGYLPQAVSAVRTGLDEDERLMNRCTGVHVV